jgi:signal transduction histidine kinase
MAASVLAPDVGTTVIREPKPWTVWAVALAGCAAAASSLVLVLTSDAVNGDVGEPLVIALLGAWITVSYVLCGLIAWLRRPASRFGPLMIAAAFASFLTELAWTTSDVPFTIGQALDLLPPVLFLHVFLAYPSGRLRGLVERALIVTAYASAIGLQLVRMSLGGLGPHNLLEVASDPGAALAVLRVQLVVVSACCLGGVGILAARRRRGGRPLRRSLALLIDAFALGLVMIAFLLVSYAFGGPVIAEIRWATFVTLGVAPVALLIGFLHDRLARSAVGELIVELRTDPAPADLRDALARALRDPSLTLAYWLPEFGSYADHDGQPVQLPNADDCRSMRLIDRQGARVAALLHDPALRDEPELLAAVTAAAGIALENARLGVELRARVEELRGSRARIVEAGQRERQRLERNLHDGAQHRLVALSLQLSLLEEQLAGDRSATAQLEQARGEIDTSLEELREIAQGIHPAVVSGHGLPVALEQLAALAQVPVRLKVEIEGRLPEAVEVAAYYLISEALANVGKYAQASLATVEVRRSNGQIQVEVIDDGIGGADTERGSGLRGLADRVEALGGRLRVWSPRGGGTRVSAEIPCVS